MFSYMGGPAMMAGNVMGNGQMGIPGPGGMLFNPALAKKVGPTPAELEDLRQQKRVLLEKYGIKELSPIAKAADGKSDNPASTSNAGYETLKKYSGTPPWMRKHIQSGVTGLHQEIKDFYKVSTFFIETTGVG